MRRFAIVAVLAAGLAAGCSSDSGTNPDDGGSNVTNQNTVFTVTLVSSNEVPPIANVEQAASGLATITFHTTRTSGTITAATVDFVVTAAGFPAGSTVTSAHIHPGAAGTNGTVLVNTGLASTDAPLANGACAFTKTGITVAADQATAILASPGSYYFNVHSVMNVGGVIRGQLGTGVSSAPEPGPSPAPY